MADQQTFQTLFNIAAKFTGRGVRYYGPSRLIKRLPTAYSNARTGCLEEGQE